MEMGEDNGDNTSQQKKASNQIETVIGRRWKQHRAGKETTRQY